MLLKNGQKITLREENNLLSLMVRSYQLESELLKRKATYLQIYSNSMKKGCTNPVSFAKLEQSIAGVEQEIYDLLEGRITSCDQLLDEDGELA
jgi:hypothetical protein